MKFDRQALIRSMLGWGGAILRLFPASHYVLLALVFAVGLELIFTVQRWVVLEAIVVVGIIIVGVVLVRLEEGGRFRLPNVILPVLATTGLSGFAFLLPTSPILHIYILAAALILFFLLKHGTREAYPIWNWVLSLVILFLNVAFVLGLRFHLYIPVLLLLPIVMTLVLLASWQSLLRAAPNATEAWLPSLGVSLALTEVVWVLQFWPVHYMVQSGLVVTMYYVMFSLLRTSYSRRLATGDIIEYSGIGTVASIIILFFARWV